MINMRIAIHDACLEDCGRAIGKGKLGKYHLTLDRPGWRMGETDHGPPPEADKVEEEIVQDQIGGILAEVSDEDDGSDEERDWLDSIRVPEEGMDPLSESDPDYLTESSSDSDTDIDLEQEEPWTEAELVREARPDKDPSVAYQPTILESWKLDPQEVFQASPTGDKRMARDVARRVLQAGGSPSGLPSWLGVRAKGRPDGVLIVGMLRGHARQPPKRKNDIQVLLLEFTRTSEAYWTESQAAKHAQHEEVVRQVREAGYKCTLVIIQIGVRAGVPDSTIASFMKLGIPKAEAKLLGKRLGRKSAVASVKAWWTRGHLCKRKYNPLRSKPGVQTRSLAGQPGIRTVCPRDMAAVLRQTVRELNKREKIVKAKERDKFGDG